MKSLADGNSIRGVFVVSTEVRKGKIVEIGSSEERSGSKVDVRSREVTVENGLLIARLVRGLSRRESLASLELLASICTSPSEVIWLDDRSNVLNWGAGKVSIREQRSLEDKRRVSSNGNDGSK